MTLQPPASRKSARVTLHFYPVVQCSWIGEAGHSETLGDWLPLPGGHLVLFDIVHLGFDLSAGLEFASTLLFRLPVAGITGVTGWVSLRVC